MSVFGGEYASYYDLFYADKDYAAEASFVRDVIRRHSPEAQSVLELGCGSGRHAIELVRDGHSVTGIDISAAMVAWGRRQVEKLPPPLREQVTFEQGDATRFSTPTEYDAVISLFHVVSYQTSNDALRGIFRSARAALAPHGVFVFDFWYGPAVLTERPQVRVRRVDARDVRVTRIAEPEHDVNRNVVDVKYTLLIHHNGAGRTEDVREVHSMRYFFLPELELLASAAGLEIVESGEWLTGKQLHDGCWSGYVAARPTRC